MTTSSSWRCATTIGSWYSRNSGSPARCGSGPSRSSPFACQSCSISAPTRLSVPTSLRSPTTIGSSITSYLMVPAQAYVGEFLETFRDYPQRQKAASFNLDDVLRKMQESYPHVTQPNRIGGRRPCSSAGAQFGCESGRWRKGADRRIWLGKRREHQLPPVQPTRCALSTKATRIRRRSSTWIGTATSIGTPIGVGHCPFCCGQRRRRGQIERSWSPAAERPRLPFMRCASLMLV